MTSSLQPADATPDDRMATPLTVAAGWHSVLPVPARPIEAWIDLMEVVEALCPAWPRPEPRAEGVYPL